MKWEYCCIFFNGFGTLWSFSPTSVQTSDLRAEKGDRGLYPLVRAVAKLGAEGWELVCQSGLFVTSKEYVLWFKRPMKE